MFSEMVKAFSENPAVWEKEIRAFEKDARKHPPAQNATLFVGSSSIRFWRTLEMDMAPIPVVKRGFGGSKLAALDYFAERLVDLKALRAIVVYSGANDITPKRSKDPQQLLRSFRSFIEKVRAKLPEVQIYYIGVCPSPCRWKAWPVAQEANRLIQGFCETEAGLDFIDTSEIWMDPDGLPDKANYLWIDRLHPNRRGYARWAQVIRPVLMRHYPEFEV